MARALFNGRILFATLSDGIALSSRGFSSSSAAAVVPGMGMMEEKASLMTGMKKLGTTSSDGAAAPMPWVPDPVTGYYRPANHLGEIDPADLRQMFLKNLKSA